MTLTPNYEHAAAYVQALTGSLETVLDWRLINDKDKSVPAYNRRGTLAQVWAELVYFNTAEPRGVFVCINETDGQGRKRENITRLRAAVADLDNVTTSASMYAAAMAGRYVPHFTVWSSPNKYHLYWMLQPVDAASASGVLESTNRRLARQFDGDREIWDTPRVLRVAGFYHHKAEPHLITINAGGAWGQPGYALADLAGWLATVPDEGADAAGGTRQALGTPALAAPSLDWAVYALNKIDPNTCGRDEWIKATSAYKQAAWSHSDPGTVRAHWDAWCARYAANDLGENNKQWNDIERTSAGWPALRQSSGVAAELMFGQGPAVVSEPDNPMGSTALATVGQVPTMPGAGTVQPVAFGPVLTPEEQAAYFNGCVLVENLGRIFTPSKRFLDVGKFNAKYGGHQFIIKADGGAGATTDEPWKAATRGQVYRVPKVDHVRFLPAEAPGSIIVDELGRKGVNTYAPAVIDTREGDPSPWINHLRLIMPTEHDLLILLNYFARIVQSPGIKIPWAPVIQSAEGVGKNTIKFAMTHAIGRVYVYYPKATELAETGGQFNAWMRNRLFILCDEVKTDEKRNLIEALKDMVSEELIQIQGKGVDQDIEDNPANWCFFTNWKDAIPIDRKARRWAIFFSPLQTEQDIINAGMDAAYFNRIYSWLRIGGGKQIVAHFLRNYPIDPALDPAINQRAPKTSSYEAAIVSSRTGPEAAIIDAIEHDRAGFKGGWLSSAAVKIVLKETDQKLSHAALTRIIEQLGYVKIGRAGKPYVQEEWVQPNLYNRNPAAQIGDYGRVQGYE